MDHHPEFSYPADGRLDAGRRILAHYRTARGVAHVDKQRFRYAEGGVDRNSGNGSRYANCARSAQTADSGTVRLDRSRRRIYRGGGDRPLGTLAADQDHVCRAEISRGPRARVGISRFSGITIFVYHRPARDCHALLAGTADQRITGRDDVIRTCMYQLPP